MWARGGLQGWTALAAAALAWPLGAPAAEPPLAGLGLVSGSYAIEPGRTRIAFDADALGMPLVWGAFGGARGWLLVDTADLGRSRLEVSVSTAQVVAPRGRLGALLTGPRWLDAAKWPQMSFRSTAITPAGGQMARLDGELTLHGITRPISLQARFERTTVDPADHRITVGFEAKGVISRSQFGLTSRALPVGDAVRLTIRAAFERAASPS